MNKKLWSRKIRIQDNRKWLIKLFASFGIWFTVTLMIVSFAERTEDYVWFFALISIVMVIYWIITYNTTKKEITIKQFMDEEKNYHDDYKRRILTKCGLNEHEINEILKGKKGKSEELDDEVEEYDEAEEYDENKNYVSSYTRTGFVIVIIASIIIGALLENVLIGFVSFGFGLLFILPIFYSIGSSKQVTVNVAKNLPKQLDFLVENGINVDEKYLSSSGSGIIIDRESNNIAIVQSNNPNTEPAIIPFEFVKKCDFYENKEQRIKESPMGEVGAVFNNEYLKERGKYDGRTVETIVTEMGMVLVIGLEKMETLKIPYYAGTCNENVLINTKIDIMNAVENVNSIIDSKTSSNVDLTKQANELLSQGEHLIKISKINEKLTSNKVITKKEISYLLEHDSVVDLSDDIKQGTITQLEELYKALKEMVPKESDDYKKLKHNYNEIKKIMSKETFMRSDQAVFHNLSMELEEINNKYYKE